MGAQAGLRAVPQAQAVQVDGAHVLSGMGLDWRVGGGASDNDDQGGRWGRRRGDGGEREGTEHKHTHTHTQSTRVITQTHAPGAVQMGHNNNTPDKIDEWQDKHSVPVNTHTQHTLTPQRLPGRETRRRAAQCWRAWGDVTRYT